MKSVLMLPTQCRNHVIDTGRPISNVSQTRVDVAFSISHTWRSKQISLHRYRALYLYMDQISNRSNPRKDTYIEPISIRHRLRTHCKCTCVMIYKLRQTDIDSILNQPIQTFRYRSNVNINVQLDSKNTMSQLQCRNDIVSRSVL